VSITTLPSRAMNQGIPIIFNTNVVALLLNKNRILEDPGEI